MKENKSGRRIRLARAMQNPPITQDDLAARMQIEALNISKGIMSRIETGDRYVTDLELLTFSKVLNVSVPWLLEQTDNPKR